MFLVSWFYFIQSYFPFLWHRYVSIPICSPHLYHHCNYSYFQDQIGPWHIFQPHLMGSQSHQMIDRSSTCLFSWILRGSDWLKHSPISFACSNSSTFLLITANSWWVTGEELLLLNSAQCELNFSPIEIGDSWIASSSSLFFSSPDLTMVFCFPSCAALFDV